MILYHFPEVYILRINKAAIFLEFCKKNGQFKLLLRKVMTNLDGIFKSRDITLPTKVCLVKAMVFPMVMYGCESWTVKKAEHRELELMLLNCGIGEDS